MKKEKKKKTVCLERSQIKMLFDVLRRRRKCNAATEFIGAIDEEFESKKKKVVKRKRSKSWWEEWL